MNSPIQKIALLAVSVVVGVTAANANPIKVTTLVTPGNYGDGTVQSAINSALTSWNLNHTPKLPTTGIGSTANVKVNSGDTHATVPAADPIFGANTLSISIPAGGYNYVFLHWGGSGGAQLFYIGGDTGTDTFTAPGQNGLSFYSLYSPVTKTPDAGSTAALLGSGLVVLALSSRKRNSR